METPRSIRRKPTWRREFALAAAGALVLPFAWRDSMAQSIDSVATKSAQGTVRRMTTAPMGEIDGAVLDDGTVLHWPPHLADRFTTVVSTGDRVRAVGRMETGPKGDTHLEAQNITNLRTNTSIENDGPQPGPGPGRRQQPPPPPRRGPRPENDPAATASRIVTGKVRRLTTAPMGEIDGAILEDGIVVHWPPHLAARFAAVVVAGEQVKLRGWTETGTAGDTHFEVQTASNLGTNASAENEPGGPRPPRPLRVAPESSKDFDANPATTESLQRRVKALEDEIAQLKDEIRKIRDEL